MSPRIQVAEQFYSIQGEGPNAGTPAYFLRLAGCNLSCGWHDDLDEYEPGDEPQGDAKWVCDTIDVWREPEETYQPQTLVGEWEEEGVLDKFRQGAHLILTGGEPTLPEHQKAFTALMDAIPSDARPYVEVETNGTQALDGQFIADVNLFNVSLKLSNSGMAEGRRLNDAALSHYKIIDGMPGQKTALLKFVISSWDDIDEIDEILEEYELPGSMVSVMPAGQTQENLRKTYPIAAEVAKERGWRFSPRLQVDTWGEVTGV